MHQNLLKTLSAYKITIIDIASTLEVPVSEAIKLIDGEISIEQAEKIRGKWFKNQKLDDLFKNE